MFRIRRLVRFKQKAGSWNVCITNRKVQKLCSYTKSQSYRIPLAERIIVPVGKGCGRKYALKMNQ